MTSHSVWHITTILLQQVLSSLTQIYRSVFFHINCVFKVIYLVLSIFCTFLTWTWPQHAAISSVLYILLHSCQRRYSCRAVLYWNVCWPTVMYLQLGHVTSRYYIHIRIARDASRVLQTPWLLGKTCFVYRITTRQHPNDVATMYCMNCEVPLCTKHAPPPLQKLNS